MSSEQRATSNEQNAKLASLLLPAPCSMQLIYENLAPSHSTAAIRSAAFPSHRSIVGRVTFPVSRLPFKASLAALTTAALVDATSRFVPWVHVIGRSVLGRTVMHGTPRKVVSSCNPPESVTTSAARATRLSISRYGIGSSRVSPP